MTTFKKQGIIFLAGLTAILLIGIFGHSPQQRTGLTDQKVITDKDTKTSSCDDATQWTPHGPYVGPVN
jgi:hypothetical protein